MTKPSPRAVAAAIAAVITAAAIAGCSSKPPAAAPTPASNLEKTHLVVASTPADSIAGFDIAIMRGYFRQAGLSVSFQPVASGDAATAELIGGSVDVVSGADVGFLLAQYHHVSSFTELCGAYNNGPDVVRVMVPKGSPIRSPAQLKGKTIAVNALNSVAQMGVMNALKPYGLTKADVRLVVIPFPDMLTALTAGRVDSAYMPEPFGTEAGEKAGAQALLDINQGAIKGLPIAGYWTTAAWVQRYPHTAAAFFRAVEHGQETAARDHTAVEAALHKYTQIPLDVLQTMSIGQYPTGPASLPQLQRVANIMTQFGVLPQHMDVTPMVYQPPQKAS